MYTPLKPSCLTGYAAKRSSQCSRPIPQTMPTLALGGSVGTGTEGIDADAVMVKDLEALAALPAGAVKDKIVFFSNRMERTQDGAGYGKAVAVRASAPSAAAALGATGIVIRSVSTSNSRFPHTGALRYSTHRAANSRAGDFQSRRRRAGAAVRERQARPPAHQEQLARFAAGALGECGRRNSLAPTSPVKS